MPGPIIPASSICISTSGDVASPRTGPARPRTWYADSWRTQAISSIWRRISTFCAGDYAQAVEQNRRAVRADDKYLAHAGPVNFYTTARCHNLHLLIYAAMFLGQYETAIAAADRICATATPELVASSHPFMASILDGYAAMRTHVYVRFGKWRELIEDRLPDSVGQTSMRIAMHRYGKAVAHAALGEIASAEAEKSRFNGLFETIPEDTIFLSNTVRDILNVGKAMLEGELEYRKQNFERALMRCARRSSATTISTLRNLGHGCIRRGTRWAHSWYSKAGSRKLRAVYRTDLGHTGDIARCSQHPDNVWALHDCWSV